MMPISRLAREHRSVLALAAAMLISAVLPMQAQRPASWLDTPIANWNAGGRIPAAPRFEEPKAAVVSRCKLALASPDKAQRAVGAAGWIPFKTSYQQAGRKDVQIVGGMAGADGMCRPAPFNLFVFVDGRFAGTLSPVPMKSRADGAAGAITVTASAFTAEFLRYTSSDPLCCPSSRVMVRYRIDKGRAGPLLVPTTVVPVPK